MNVISAGAAMVIAALLSFVPSVAAAESHTLVWADGLDINILNPLLPGAAPNDYLTEITMAFLTVSGNGPVEPELAVRVPTRRNGGISGDGKTITFELRPNLKWSDGAPLTSEDVAFSVALINDPKTNIPGREGYELVRRVETPTKTKVVMHLAHPYGPILHYLFSDIDAPIFPKHLLAGQDPNTAEYMQLPIGAGPFRYTKWVRGDRVELEANPYYFRGVPKLKKIVFRSIPSSQSSAIALQTGETDFWPAAGPDEVELLNGVPSLKRIVLPGVRPAILMFNTTAPSVDDVRVRDALRLGLNRASIMQKSYHGGGVLDDTIVSRNDPAYERVSLAPYDAAKAARLLEASGWNVGPDGVRSKAGKQLHITLVGITGSVAVQQVLELVRADWKRIGAIVDTRYYPASILFSASPDQGILASGKFDVAFFSYGQVRTSTLSSGFRCAAVAPKASNYSRICDRRLDMLFARYDATYDDVVAAKIARAIQARLNELLPAIIIGKRDEYYIMRNTVSGFHPQPFSPFAGSIMDVDVTK